ncbi:hypothetical protein AKJ09_04710 [Labilithrix luteola]|uniref:Uncharacterized protein n=1 Tax=Labilithrix luteola TaxID=1391654 RepID=A0A0K1PXD2_9BACT|nr:hypothetical protein [Labilithrix luteola]AKU98046.1 hypothetical protein AKJ09_04710 [Labilithrix luteola]
MRAEKSPRPASLVALDVAANFVTAANSSTGHATGDLATEERAPRAARVTPRRSRCYCPPP